MPTPPGPTRLTRRAVVSFFLISPSSRRRPTKVVASAGRLPERCLGLAILNTSRAGGPVTGSTTHRIINPDDVALPAVTPTLASMNEELPTRRVEVTFVGLPATRQITRASGVSEVEVDGSSTALPRQRQRAAVSRSAARL